MHSRFTIPVLVATALHALVWLGSGRSPERVVKPPEKPATVRAFVVPKEDLEEPVVATDPEPVAPPKGVREALRPAGEEPPPNPLPDGYRFEPVRVPPGAEMANIVPGLIGDPLGTDEMRAGPVLDYRRLDNSPRTRVQSPPVYPHEARQNGLTGEVLVEFTVDEDGRVMDPRVVRSSQAMFEAPTLTAVAKWRFEPGRKSGRAVRFRMMVPVRFGLDR